MRTVWRFVFALLLVAVAVWPVTALASDAIITLDPQATTSAPILLSLPSDVVDGTYSLYIRNTTDAELKNLELLCFIQDHTHRPMSGVAATFKTAEGSALGAFSLPAGAVRSIQLEIGKLTDHGEFTGTITLRRLGTEEEGKPATPLDEVLAHFTLIHPGSIQILEADAERKLSLESSVRDFKFPLTLWETTGQANVDALAVEVGGFQRKDGGAGDPATVGWSWANGKADPQTLGPGERRTVFLEGTLPDATTYGGWLMLKHGDRAQLYSLDFTRSITGRLAVLETSPTTGDVQLNVRGPSFDPVITLLVGDGQPPIQDLTMEVTGLQRQDGQALQTETLSCSLCDETSHSLAPGVAQAVTLEGENFKPVAYRAILRLGLEGLSQSVPLIIQRSPLATNLQVDKPEPVAAEMVWPWAMTITVPIQVSETQGEQAQLYYPSPGALTLTAPDGTKSSVTADQVSVLQRNSLGKLEPLPTPAGAETVMSETLPAYGGLVLAYRFTNLRQAGTYLGKIDITGPDSAKVTQEFTIQVRHHWVYAFCAILAGVWLSYYWHNWTKEGRSRALLARDITETQESIEAIIKDMPELADATWSKDLCELGDKLLGDLGELHRNRRDDPSKLAEHQQKLQWIQARKGHYSRAVHLLKTIDKLLKEYPHPDSTKPYVDEKRRKAYENLRELSKALQETYPPDPGPDAAAAKAADCVTKLEELEATIREDAITARVQDLIPGAKGMLPAARALAEDIVPKREPWWQAPEPQSSLEWDALIRRNDRLIFWISLLIAAISGLSALYLTNSTFGSLSHYITAILWGFGIQASTDLAAAGAPGIPKIGSLFG